jgi:hypothetical protein
LYHHQSTTNKKHHPHNAQIKNYLTSLVDKLIVCCEIIKLIKNNDDNIADMFIGRLMGDGGRN